MNIKTVVYLILAVFLAFSVSAIGPISILGADVEVSGAPGEINNSQSITVQNTDTADFDVVNFTVTELVDGTETIPVSAVTLTPTTADISAGADQIVNVLVSIPSGQKAGTYTGTIEARYDELTHDSTTLTVEVRSVPGYTASAESLTVAQGLSGQITVTITNTGNDDITGLDYELTPTFTSGANTLTTSSAATGTLNVNHDSTVTLPVVFNPPADQATGAYSGGVNFSYAGVNRTLDLAVTIRAQQTTLSMPHVEYAESNREENVSKTITIENTGDFGLTGITLTTTAPDTVIENVAPASLTAGSSFTTTVTTYIDDDTASGVKDIGDLVFSSDQLDQTSNIVTNVESMLSFERVRVSIDGGSWDTVSDGDTVDDDAKPGDSFAVKVRLENTFDNDDGFDIDDITVFATFFEAGEDRDDVDGETDEFDVDAGDESDEEVIDFDEDEIDWEAPYGELLVTLYATGRDRNNAVHRAYLNFSVNLDRENRAEFIFTRLDAPSTASCGRSITLYADGRSIGTKSDDEVVLKFNSDSLSISISEEFEMGAYDDDNCIAFEDDEDDCTEFEYRKSINIPADVREGSHKITAKLFRDGGSRQTDEKDIQVTVECGEGTSSSGTSSSGSTTGTTTDTTAPSGTQTTTSGIDVFYGSGDPQTGSQGAVASSTKITDLSNNQGFRGSGVYIALLSLLSIFVVVGIVVLVVYMVTKPKV
ncbi:hypothetical protein HQ545_00745 [Candidatus Woesearchaeota archaeon]|nr:hypothetical protein [Candidatus Woesearchaeota archaeon]